MRLKHIPGSEEAVAASPQVIHEPESMPGRWKEYFGGRKIALEIGCGKGKFLFENASLNGNIAYVGVDFYSSVLIKALKKDGEQLPNLRFLWMDASKLTETFAPGEVDIIYLNFSDPWPKDRHAKRRLTAPGFLKKWQSLLAPDGRLEFKTDNMPLFDWSAETLKNEGWTITVLTHDLHNDPVLFEGNIMTEYEAKFSAKGNPIGKLIALPPKT
ncbi:MAG: tRNA (guanosine(46)-N7)-methyltransferase TrmB [Lachnospiraceae bacterium]|nr:tRNA (guanosine(46)-N7)-methyltransferase TrmB [Lachnospiraceae bacterium]